MRPKVAIIMGSDSDLEVMKGATETLEAFKIPFQISIVSAHRTPTKMYTFAKNAKSSGIKVIIAGAGGAAHLPGMTASMTTLPVIGVPIETKAMKGLDSLLSIAQMPTGVPVATVAVNGAPNAALLALKIIAVSDQKLTQKIRNYKNKMKNESTAKSAKLEKVGAKTYLKEKNDR